MSASEDLGPADLIAQVMDALAVRVRLAGVDDPDEALPAAVAILQTAVKRVVAQLAARDAVPATQPERPERPGRRSMFTRIVLAGRGQGPGQQ